MGEACRQLGPGDPQLYKDALRAFDEAADADPGDPSPRTARGSLYLAKYDSVSARQALKAVLERNPQHPGALLAMARAMDFDGERGALALAAEALRVAPNRIEARVYVAEARLEMESYDEAIAEAERALETDPSSLEALSVLAGARYLKGEDAAFATTRDRVLALNPRYADLYNTLAELCVRNRLYRKAVEFASEAVRLDPRSWRGHATLGVNQLRLGAIDTGRASLETAFAGDPYNVWTKNTLDLLDTFKRYETRRVGRLELFVRGEEAALLQPYLVAYADEALEKLEARYGYRVEAPVRVEVFPSHADFSVRTVGLAGLGALGVCFGNVVAIDSPSARPRGSFNWGSTLWHELAHSVTLGLSDHRVPRWLTEGISVREERRARPGWGDDVSLEFIAALETGKLLPIAGLNNGFVRPEGPEQVARSYYQASLVVELIERDHGFEAVPRLLMAYGDRRSTEELFASVLGHEPRAVRRPLRGHLRERFSHVLAAVHARRAPARGSRTPTPPRRAGRDGRRCTRRLPGAARRRQGAHRKPPACGGASLSPRGPSPSSPSTPRTTARAGCWRSWTWKARTPRRLAATSRLSSRSTRRTSTPTSAWRGARAARRPGGGGALARARALHLSLRSRRSPPAGRALRRAGRHGRRRARPSQRARPRPRGPARGPLPARAGLLEAGDAAEARREVLRALELAPRFRRAQELLLGCTARRRRRAEARREEARLAGARVLAGLLPAAADFGQPARPALRERALQRPLHVRRASASTPRAPGPGTTPGASTSSGTTTTRAPRPTS